MLTFTAREAKNRFGEVLNESQKQEVIVTRNGRPFARVMGVDLVKQSTTTDQLYNQEQRLLSYMGVGVLPSDTTQSPEGRIRELRDEW